jgi:hypothetical protein
VVFFVLGFFFFVFFWLWVCLLVFFGGGVWVGCGGGGGGGGGGGVGGGGVNRNAWDAAVSHTMGSSRGVRRPAGIPCRVGARARRKHDKGACGGSGVRRYTTRGSRA